MILSLVRCIKAKQKVTEVEVCWFCKGFYFVDPGIVSQADGHPGCRSYKWMLKLGFVNISVFRHWSTHSFSHMSHGDKNRSFLAVSCTFLFWVSLNLNVHAAHFTPESEERDSVKEEHIVRSAKASPEETSVRLPQEERSAQEKGTRCVSMLCVSKCHNSYRNHCLVWCFLVFLHLCMVHLFAGVTPFHIVLFS